MSAIARFSQAILKPQLVNVANQSRLELIEMAREINDHYSNYLTLQEIDEIKKEKTHLLLFQSQFSTFGCVKLKFQGTITPLIKTRWQNQGHGKAMIKATESWAKNRGISQIQIPSCGIIRPNSSLLAGYEKVCDLYKKEL